MPEEPLTPEQQLEEIEKLTPEEFRVRYDIGYTPPPPTAPPPPEPIAVTEPEPPPEPPPPPPKPPPPPEPEYVRTVEELEEELAATGTLRELTPKEETMLKAIVTTPVVTPDVPKGATLVEGIPSWEIDGRPVPVQYRPVTITDWKGKKIQVPGIDVWKYNQVRGEAQFDLAVKMGLIPPDSKFVQGIAGAWTYIPHWEEHLEELRKERLARAPVVRARAEARRTMEKYRTDGDSFDLAQARAEGVSVPVIIAAGFTSGQLDAVKDMVTYLKASPEGKFKILQKEGQIPPDATFQEMDREGNILYAMAGTPVEITAGQLLLTERPETQEFIIRHALRLPMLAEVKPFDKLTEAQQERVLSYYATRQKLKPIGEVVTSLVPVIGTAYFWQEMRPSQRALSIGLDALFFASPFIIPKAIGLVKGLGKVKGTVKVIENIKAGNKQTLSFLRQNVSTLVKPFKKVTSLQQKYASQKMYVNQLEALIKRGVGEVQPEVIRSLRLARRELETLKGTLTSATKDYVKQASGLVGFDDPLVAKQLTELPSSLIRATDSLVETITKPRTIVAISEDLRAAQTALKAAQAKWATAPARWSDLAQDVAKFEAELLTRQAGSVAELHQQLVRAKETIPRLTKLVNEARIIDSPYLADLERALIQARLQARQLPGLIDNMIKKMEVEWGRGGWLGAGRMPVLAPAKPGVIAPRGGGVKPATIFPPTPAITRISMPLMLDIEETRTPQTLPAYPPMPIPWTPYPDIKGVPGVKPIIVPGVSHPVVTQIRYLFRSLVDTGKTPQEAIVILASPGIFPEQYTVTQIKAAVAPETATFKAQRTPGDTPTEAARLRAEKIATTFRIPPPPKKKVVKPKVVKVKRYPITWRLGELKGVPMWWVISPPYETKADVKLLGYRPEGAKVVKDQLSAYQTIQGLGGNAEITLHLDLGTQDILIDDPTRKPGKKGAIRFRADPKQKTTGDIDLTGVKLRPRGIVKGRRIKRKKLKDKGHLAVIAGRR